MNTQLTQQLVMPPSPNSGNGVSLNNPTTPGAPQVFTRPDQPTPTKVFDTYWRFAAERQRIFFARLNGEPMPWTGDPVLKKYKFTNAYRASDRVSQYLIRNVIYSEHTSPTDVFFRTLLFKIFNRIETWELLLRELGEITFGNYAFDLYDEVLSKAKARGERLYSPAYMMAATREIGAIKHRMHLRIVEQMVEDRLPDRLLESRSMEDAFNLLKERPMIGNFLAYQYVIDLNYGPLLSFSEMDFVMPGPGATDGILKCFSSLGGRTKGDIIKMVTDRQNEEFAARGLEFQSLWGRPLQLIDCQNLFCEVDKYSRVVHPEFAGRSRRTEIKQRFNQNPKAISYWYPPKWGLNDLISMNGSVASADLFQNEPATIETH